MFFLTADRHFKEIITGSKTSLVFRLLGVATGYLQILVVTRLFSLEAMGVFALGLSIMLILSSFGSLGMQNAQVRFVAESVASGAYSRIERIYRKVLSLTVPASLFLTAMFFALGPVIAQKVFVSPGLELTLIPAAICILPNVLLRIHTESLRGLKHIGWYAFFANVSTTSLTILLLLAASTFSRAERAPMLAYLCAIFLSAVFSYVIWRKSISRLPADMVRKSVPFPENYRHLISVSLPMLVTTTILLMFGWVDTILLGILSTKHEVGMYYVAYKTSMLSIIILTTVNSVSAPTFAALFTQGKLHRLKEVVRKNTRLVLATSMPILLLLVIFPSPVLRMFGTELNAGSTALVILVLGHTVNILCGPVGHLLNMTGNQKAFLYAATAGIVANFLLDILLIPRFGIEGAAAASAIGIVIMNISSVISAKINLDIWTIYFPTISRK